MDERIYDEGQQKRPYKTHLRCHFAHHKFHMKYSHIETGPMRWEAGN
jgi:hypothetical protein